jgi:nucleoside-diphosphate-sugar epimerase
MKVVITGGGGFIGLRLAKALLARGTLVAGDKSGDKQQAIARITLLDTSFAPNPPSDARLEIIKADIADPAVIERVVTPDTASIFHLAAVVSGGAESDFDL